MYFEPDEKTETDLAEAMKRLKEFEEKTAETHRMARLRHEDPRHPFLIGMAAVSVVSVLLAVVGTLVIGITIASPEFQRNFAQYPMLNVLPVAALGFAVCGGILYGVLYLMALQRGADSPRMPKDLAQMNRLRSDVMRLEAAKKVAKRLSETPAPNRRVGFPGSR